MVEINDNLLKQNALVLQTFNPFLHESYSLLLKGNFITAKFKPADTLCLSCTSRLFVNLIHAPLMLYPHNQFPDRLAYHYFFEKARLSMKHVKYLDQLDSVWLALSSNNYKLLCAAYILYKDHAVNPNNPAFGCSCDAKPPHQEVYKEAANFVCIRRQQGDAIWDEFSTPINTAGWRKITEDGQRGLLIIQHHLRNLFHVSRNDIYNRDALIPMTNTVSFLLEQINPGLKVPLSPEIEDLIKKHNKFYKRFRLQNWWHGEFSFAISKRKLRRRWLNRISHPRWWRKSLKSRLSAAVRSWLDENHTNLFLDIAFDYFIDLFWLAVVIDALHLGAKGKLKIELPDGVSSFSSSRKVTPL